MKNIDFDRVYNILQASFEPFLYRDYERQKDLLKNDKYNIITYKKNDDILGFLSYWELDNNFLFVEHFAVDKSARGLGIGKNIFNDFLKLKGNKFLEVEPPHTEIDKKRIKLYESFGLIFHQNEYYQPPYNLGDEKTRLHIMCSKPLDETEFNLLVKDLYKTVYNVF